MNKTFSKHSRTLASVVAAGAVLAVPAAALAAKPDDHGQANAKAHHGHAANCAKTHDVGFSLTGTLVSLTADDPATPASEATVTLTVTSANSHARRSGDVADQNADKKGVQAKGATFTVPATDAFALRLHGYQGTDTPSPGDRVKVKGRIARLSQKCAPAGASIADRLGAIDVRRVTISDRDAD
ncbi:MAG: hypothetical protein QOE11_3229 [Solirubrobacteraceae bacterium]|jgi:hypothetical protein|nr:hypothetical protein [Solirubrobacteraceae bacterium]